MSITMMNSSIVQPCEETPKGTLWLSKLDMMLRHPYCHVHVLLTYQPYESSDQNPKPSSHFFDTNILKEALSKTLVPFYPIAGRLKMNESNGRYEIDCNAEGVLFVEAETSHALVDLGDEFMPNVHLQETMVPTCDYTKGLSSIPLLMVQLTRFKCGGVCLGFAQHHHVADGTSHLHFMTSWARLARGLDVGVVPVHDRAKYLGPREPPQVKFHHLEYDPPASPSKSLSGETLLTTDCLFVLSRDQINALKLQAMSDEAPTSYKLTTFEVLAGHVWRTTCKARQLADDQEVKLYVHINGRSRLKDPSLPQGYFGNAIFFAACIDKVENLANKPLWYAAKMIHETMEKMNNNDYLRSATDYVESHSDLASLIRRSEHVACPNLYINSWARFPFYEADFGWGKPTSMRYIGTGSDGKLFLFPSPKEDGSSLLAVTLMAPHIDLFKRYLYDL